jgi:hypothetical protein
MKCVPKSLLRLMAVTLMCGVATAAFGQEAVDALRMDTDVGADIDADGVLPPPPPPPARITIGDDNVDTPRRRASIEDAYAAQGLPAGAFRLYPSLEIGSVVSSNPRLVSAGAKPDIGLRLKPQLRFESNWVRHSLTGSASLEAQQFVDNKDIKSITGSVQGALRLDVRRTTRSDIDWNYSAISTGIEDSELPATATGARLDHTLGVAASVTHDFGGIEGRLRFSVARNLFGDVDLSGGGKEDNEDRNYTQLSFAARAGLRNGAMVQPYGEIAYEPRVHDNKLDRNGVARNSQGLRLSAGVTIADDPIWSGDIAANLELRDYTDDSLATALVPGLVADVTWQPTDLTRFEFNAGASLSETVAAGSSATKTWTAGVTATLALRENLDLSAGIRAELERSSGQSTLTTTGTLGMSWTLNPSLVLGASYEGTFVNGATSGDDYTDHRLLTSIILRR